jgi:integrative and conjugative element protein (TIGR02256 family)
MKCWLPTNVRDSLIVEANQWVPQETGGVLLGYITARGDVVVTDTVGAGPNALRSRIGFLPDHEYQEDEIAQRYKASGRVHVYLGDWHSHPSGGPSLSRRDRRTLRVIASSKDARISTPIMLVISGGPLWCFTAWHYHAQRPRVRRATLHQPDR